MAQSESQTTVRSGVTTHAEAGFQSALFPDIIHGIALVETWRPVDLNQIADKLPLEYLGVPLTYMSINDFLNIVWQLRTVPEILEYLNARRELPSDCLRMVGDELPFYELYIMNGGSVK